MPPRIPVVFLFVVFYFAVAWGGGVAAPGREALVIDFDQAPRWFDAMFGLPGLRLSYADLLALLAAVTALPDLALRPTRDFLDRLMSFGCVAITVGALAYEPLLFTPGFAVLLAICVGDLLGALGQAAPRRRPAPVRRS